MNQPIERIIFDRNKILNQAKTWTDAMQAREVKKAQQQIVQHANPRMSQPQRTQPSQPAAMTPVTFSKDPEDYAKVQTITAALKDHGLIYAA